MLERIRALVDRWRELKEIDALADRDLDDLGMTRAQVTAFARMPHDAPDRMAAMAANFGISAENLRANHAQYLELLGTCGSCRDRATCALVLAKKALVGPSDCAFCPNAHDFAAMVGQVAA